jgi:uncharacterized protein (DUF433 family)
MKLDRITINPEVCLGQPTIRGMRITVSAILNAGSRSPERQSASTLGKV